MMCVKPVLQIRRSDGRDDISVAANWPDGCVREVGGFKNESEANEWIAKKFQAWVEEQEHLLMGKLS